MFDEESATDAPVGSADSCPRHWRDWLIASGSLVFFIGVAFPFYLAWRDDRRRWIGVCALLIAATVAVFPLDETAATENIAIAMALATWLGGIAAAIALAATVTPEHRRSSAGDLRSRRPAARRAKRVARLLSAGGVKAHDERPRGGTMLSEPVLLIEGVHRSAYFLHDRDDRPLGVAHPADSCPLGYRARYELLAPGGARVLALHVAERRGAQADVILAADDTELVRLQPPELRSNPPEPQAPSRRGPGRISALGFGPRLLVSDGQPIGQVRLPHGRRLARARVLIDASDTEVARVTRVLGGAGPSGTQRGFVIDLCDGVNEHIRAAALFVGVLWDWYIVSWDGGGG